MYRGVNKRVELALLSTESSIETNANPFAILWPKLFSKNQVSGHDVGLRFIWRAVVNTFLSSSSAFS